MDCRSGDVLPSNSLIHRPKLSCLNMKCVMVCASGYSVTSSEIWNDISDIFILTIFYLYFHIGIRSRPFCRGDFGWVFERTLGEI